MEELSVEKISDVLNSPDLMQNIQSVLSQLANSSETKSDIEVVSENKAPELSNIMEAFNNSGLLSSVTSFLSQNKAERIALLSALRPFLSDEKKAILDSVLQLLKLANILLATNIIK